jgi:PAS domain S-box-containing protein
VSSAHFPSVRGAGEESSALLRATLEATSDGILTVHRAGSVVTFNRRFLDLWRIPAEFARRADNERLISFVLDQLVDAGTFLRITRENQADPDREYFSLLRFRDGRVLERFSRPRLVEGEIVGRILTFRDVTERERLLERAYDAVRTREEFLSAVANDVPAPVAAMSLAVRSLLEGAAPGETLGSAIDWNDTDQPRLASLVQTLVDLARLRAGSLLLEREPVDLVSVARDGLRRHAEDLLRSGSTVSLSGSEIVLGQWNRSALDQIFSNLLSNAIKFGRGKPIEVRLGERPGHAMLTVRDRGLGIPSEIAPRIFAPVEQGAWARTDGKLSLGLYVVRTIVEALGGKVHVESQLNVGTSFGVELPKAGLMPG